MLAKLDAVVTAIAKGGGEAAAGGKPVQIVIGNKVIEEIKSQMDVNQSYNVSTGNAGEA
jgi:phosphotransferase system IIB component